MADLNITRQDKTTRAEFDKLLGEYPALIGAISGSKGAKEGQRTLQELDQFRYVDALQLFGQDKPPRSMNLDDVKTLVDWKLRHGKFRPTLMKLVSSNEFDFAEETIHSAISAYREKPDIQAALAVLTKLKGIGPATASLLLSVHDPRHVIFFSDEAFYWLCSDGKKSSIKYNAKEYEALQSEANTLAERLGVSATDIEKVAYVIMKRIEQPGPSKSTSRPKSSQAKAPSSSKGAKPSGSASSTKRKTSPGDDIVVTQSTARRSKRTKA